MENTDPYRPCPCGSGKKFKFCCKAKESECAMQETHQALRVLSGADDVDAELPDHVLVGDFDEGRLLCEKGLKFMGKGRFKEAIPWFRKARDAFPAVYTPANNWALCLFITGQLNKAIQVQEQSMEESPLPNCFGLANLAAFYLIKGQEQKAERHLTEALDMEIPTADACVKVCESLARFGRHQDILDVADESEYAHDSGVCFFAGIAAANLGENSLARDYLRRVGLGHHKADMAQRYLRHLQDKSTPHTVRGDWPYLLQYEICPLSVIEAEIKRDQADWTTRRVAVNVCEGLLNENADDADSATSMLALLKHPDATALLWTIVKGTFGPDQLRMAALSALQKRGEIKHNQKVEMVTNGGRTTVATMGMKLDPEIRFGGMLPPALDKINIKAIKAGQGRKPDWGKLGEDYQHIMREAQDYYPARYNYAVSLLHRQRQAEAEPILSELVEQYPGYLFAPATLLQIFTMQGRKTDAEALIRSVTLPEETHPSAMVAWLIAQALYYEYLEDFKTTRRCLEAARDVDPDHPTVKMLWRDYK
jgi:tetratricopeptide (TPR) repeat protein